MSSPRSSRTRGLFSDERKMQRGVDDGAADTGEHDGRHDPEDAAVAVHAVPLADRHDEQRQASDDEDNSYGHE